MSTTKRVLIFPNTNTLSHLSRALACCEWLEADGWEAFVGVSAARCAWAATHHPRCLPVLEPWTPTDMPYPCPGWFGDRGHIEACIRSQEAVIRSVRPHLIIGIFDFLSAISAGPIPRISINGACMLPIYRGVLGFDSTVSARRCEQERIYASFWAYGARQCAMSLQKRGLAPKGSALELLVGDTNLIYEIEPVCRMGDLPAGYHLIGPIVWEQWEKLGAPVPWRKQAGETVLYLNSGTLMKSPQITDAIIRVCLATGCRLLVSSGANGSSVQGERLFCHPFLAPLATTALADVAVCTGGVGACYTNLLCGVPSLVVPMQPEQATNGLNLERAQCGKTLIRNTVFFGDSQRYENAFDERAFADLLRSMLAAGEGAAGLPRLRAALSACDARGQLVAFAEACL